METRQHLIAEAIAGRTWFPTAVLLILFSGHLCWGQQAPAQVSLTFGAGYDQGDFGSTETSSAAYFPASIQYSTAKFDVSVRSSWVRLDSPSGVILIDGVPTRTDSTRTAGRDSGMGDTFFRSRLHLVTDAASISPYLRLKIPTADETRGLGTGKADYGLGVEIDKDFGEVFVFGDAGYTFVGKVPRLGLRNRPSASIGASREISPRFTLSGVLDWRRAIVAGTADPAEFVGFLSYKASESVTFSPNAFVGLTNGSSDFGVGIEMRVKFGKL